MPKKERYDVVQIQGYFTRERGLLGKTPKEMARLLGYPEYRMGKGVKVYALTRFPANEEFELRGYTYWPGGTPAGMKPGQTPAALWSQKHAAIDKQWMPAPEIRVKENLRKSWTLIGPDRLVRIQPNTPDDGNYPIGDGLEQWRLIASVNARLEWELEHDERYLPYGGTRYR